MSAALPAFLLEAFFYLSAVFEETRACFRMVHPPRLRAFLLWLSALAPYLVFSTGGGTIAARPLEILAALTAILAYWYVFFPRRWAYDFGFLAIVAAPVILKVFSRIYAAPDSNLGNLHLGDALGHLMWIRLAVLSLLVLRDWNPGPFSFWPKADEWKTGTLWFVFAVGPLCLLAVSLGMVRWAPLHGPWWKVTGIATGVFFGMLWVVALSEELFFRGVIEKALLDSWGSPVVAVLLSSVLYGGSHFWYRGFPNWREALLTAALGVPCGIAYLRTGSVRAPMVTHAFAAATVRVLFRYT